VTTTSTETGGEQGRRLDARRNHERILAAAVEVFAEHGLGATVPQIADRAGVGKATVYRNYPTKDDLVAAVSAEHFRELEHRTVSALTEPDAYQALSVYIVDLFGSLAHNRLLADVLAEGTVVPSTRILALLDQLLAAARKSGRVRADATGTDIRIVLCGAVLQLMRLDVRDQATWRRYGELVMNALRPAHDTQLADAGC
jgi:AcrR family transcriptional regulator